VSGKSSIAFPSFLNGLIGPVKKRLRGGPPGFLQLVRRWRSKMLLQQRNSRRGQQQRKIGETRSAPALSEDERSGLRAFRFVYRQFPGHPRFRGATLKASVCERHGPRRWQFTSPGASWPFDQPRLSFGLPPGGFLLLIDAVRCFLSAGRAHSPLLPKADRHPLHDRDPFRDQPAPRANLISQRTSGRIWTSGTSREKEVPTAGFFWGGKTPKSHRAVSRDFESAAFSRSMSSPPCSASTT